MLYHLLLTLFTLGLLAGCQSQSQPSTPSIPQPSQSSQSSGSSSSSSSSQSSPSTPTESSSRSSSSGGAPSSPSESRQSQSSAGGVPESDENPWEPPAGEAGGYETPYEERTAGPPGEGPEQTAGTPQEGDDATMAGGGPMSQEESMEVLDEQLDESLAVFDGMILTERANVQDIEAEYEEEEAGAAAGPLFEEGDLSEEAGGAMEAAGTEGGDQEGKVAGGLPEGTAERSSGPAVQTARADGGVPADIEDGSDDDIVARQIREAAMNEKDPVLREKLWDEYRKYKNQQKAK